MGMFAGAALPPDGGTRAERFANPPGACRLLPIRHNYPFDVKNNEKQLTTMLDRGYGGFAGNVAFGSIHTNGMWKGVWKGYVDEEPFWPQFIHAVNFAKAANMSLWLYDECGYPSGTARDLTLKGHPELENTGYLIAVTTAEGGETATVKMPPGAFRRAVAWPLGADGTLAQGGCVDLAEAVAAACARRRHRLSHPPGSGPTTRRGVRRPVSRGGARTVPSPRSPGTSRPANGRYLPSPRTGRTKARMRNARG